jgi:hypothetical protein
MRCNSNLPCQWKGTVMVIIISEIVRVMFFSYNVEGKVSARNHIKGMSLLFYLKCYVNER